MKLPENTIQLAEMIHKITCHARHDDQCPYYYEKAGEDVRKKYVAYVNKLIEKYGFEMSRNIVFVMRKIQFGAKLDEIFDVDWSEYQEDCSVNRQEARPILEVLEDLRRFSPIKICFNDLELYNDYDSTKELEPGVFGEHLPPMMVVPQRLTSMFENYDVYVTKIDIRIEDYDHSIVYLYGEKVLKENDAKKV